MLGIDGIDEPTYGGSVNRLALSGALLARGAVAPILLSFCGFSPCSARTDAP